MKTKSKLLLLCGVMLLIKSSGSAFRYELEGKLDSEGYFAKNKVVIGATFFTVSVDGCRWIVRVNSESSSDIQGYKQMSFDGKDMYYFGMGPDSSGKRKRWGGAVTIESVPFFGPTPAMPVIWLALASSCYLDRNSKTLVPPYSVDVVRPQLFVQVARMVGGARLPQSIVFMDDGFNRGEGKPQRRSAPYDKGFTNAIYFASDFTKVGDTDVPRFFRLLVFGPATAGKSSTDLELAHVYNGMVTNVRAFCSTTNYVPTIPAGTEGGISDTRLASSEAVVPEAFRYRSGNWLSINQVRQLPEFASYSNSQAARKTFVPILVTATNEMSILATSHTSDTRFLLLAVMVITSAILVIFVCKKRTLQAK